MNTRAHADQLGWTPRGLSREQAARHVGVGTTKFDEMVKDGRMPKPKRVDGRLIWDRLAVEAAFSELPEDRAKSLWDGFLSSSNPAG